MTLTVVSWIVVAVNLGLCGLNAWHTIRLRRARQQLAKLQARTTAAGQDFMRRVFAGQVYVNTDDGRSGLLVLVPEGKDGMRITVMESDEDRVLH
jgi:hypothetical protein